MNQLSPANSTRSDFQLTLNQDSVRVVEVQFVPGQDQPKYDQVQRFFFPQDDADQTEGRARFLRVSGPIDIGS